jgi:hypothetical protein
MQRDGQADGRTDMTKLIFVLLATVHMRLESENKKLFLSIVMNTQGDNPFPLPLYLQVPIGPSWDRNRASAIFDGKTKTRDRLGNVVPDLRPILN